MADVATEEPAFNQAEVIKLMGKGKRHYICNEVEDAVKCFEQAAQKLAEQYGELANECGEAYLYYGKSLIDLARSETGVLGGALKVAGEQIEDEDSEDDDDEAVAEDDQMETEDSSDKGKSTDDKSTAEPSKDADEKTATEESTENQGETSATEEKEQASPKQSDTKKDEPQAAGSGCEGGQQAGRSSDAGNKAAAEDSGASAKDSGEAGQTNGDTENKEEDLGTIELAWETLEMSRLIYEGQDTKEAKLNLAQTYLKLGEIQMERELFLEAVDEFHKCYEIQHTHLEADDRLLAETLYNIGLAFSIQSPPIHSKAKEYYTKALNVVDLRVKNIEARLQESEGKDKGKKQASDDDPFVKDRKELMELQDLRPEMKAKIDDAQEMANGGYLGTEEVQSIAVKKTNGDTSKPVLDINHLVKRKRKPDETGTTEDTDENGAAKKPRKDNETETTDVQDS